MLRRAQLSQLIQSASLRFAAAADVPSLTALGCSGLPLVSSQTVSPTSRGSLLEGIHHQQSRSLITWTTTSGSQQCTCSCGACRALMQRHQHHRTCSCSTCRQLLPTPLRAVRGMACSAGLHRPPPKKIMIEYDPEDVDAYISVADAIEEAFPTVVVEGNDKAEGRPGSFEVKTDDGVQIYSKLSSHRYPNPEALISLITNRDIAAPKSGNGKPDPDAPACT